MPEKKQKKVEIFSLKIDFKELEKWTDVTKDDLPVVSYISFYRAIGLLDAAEKYAKEHPDFYLYHLDSIFCNFSTHKAIKHAIEHNWQVYDIDIDANSHVFWKEGKYKKGVKHYAKRLTNKVSQCLARDYSTYCPGIDDELPVNTITLVDWVDDDSENDNVVDVDA